MNQLKKGTSSVFFVWVIALVALPLAGLVAGCSTGPELNKQPQTAQVALDVRFAEGKKAYEKGQYLDAIKIFEDIRVQSPTSEVAAEATYLEGLSRFQEEMYSGAAVDFRALRRNYPKDPLASRAQYMIGESYFRLSPRPELDQTYSSYSIGEFQTFLRDYPGAAPTLIDSAQKRIADVRNKLAQKVFLAGELYLKMQENKAALVFYDRLLDQYYDSQYAPEAQLRIAEIQLSRHRMAESRDAILKFDSKYLESATQAQRQRARSVKDDLPNP